MDESDDDFKELCASFFQRVKKNGPKEVSGERKTQKASNSTQIRSKLKRTKPTASKSKTLKGASERKTCSGSQVPRTQKQGAPKWPESEPAPPENEEGGMCASAVLPDSAWSTQTEAGPDSHPQPPPSGLTAMMPSPSKPRAAELVLQRMQQFKRADPERLKHASEGCSLEAALEENIPKGPQEMMAGNGSGPRLPAMESDTAVALALQQEFGQGQASAHDDSLEEKGLFFCQICQKNLSAMTVTRREQHVNRCLDEAEKALRPSAPQIPECPICGKPFLTPKSRISHLKQCAVKMEIGPQLLLQAVRLQTAQPEGTSGTPASSLSDHAGRLKRKGATARKEPQKRRKVTEPEAPSEDLMVAMALSRSEMEQEAVPVALRLGNAFSERMRPGAEKKTRKKKAPTSPPQLLVQDVETTGRQIEDRVAQLLAEEVELSGTPPLPVSRILKEELEKGSRGLRPLGRKQNFLWEGSALTGAWALESFYTTSLVPPLVPQRPTEGLTQESLLPPELPEQPEPGVRTPPAIHGTHPVGHSPRSPVPSASQREHQALQDLLDLAGEGLSASPWPCSGGPSGSGGATGTDLSPGGLPLTGFVLPAKEKCLERGGQASLTLGLLVADFTAMVNNPHLSDIQLQMDGGEVLYAHKFVLYARCPLLMQHVDREGFFAVEDGGVRTQRVLLSDVSAEAARAFLRYLYTADTGLPRQLAPDLSALAHRFGVSELVHMCEQVPVVLDAEGGQQKEQEDEDCKSRVETFQELLRSVWRGEEEEAEALLKSEGHEEDREKVNEAEIEEIYEFAATQRKLLQREKAPETEEEADQLGEDGPVSAEIVTSIQDKEQSENAEQMESSGQGRDEAPAKRKNIRQSMLLPPGDQGLNGEEKAKPPKEALALPYSSSPAWGRAEKQEGTLLCSVVVGDNEQPFSSPRPRYSEPSQVMKDHKEGNSAIWERGVESFHPPAHQQAPPSHSHFFPSQPCQGRSPRRPHPCPLHTSDLSPPTPQLQGTSSRMASQNSSPKPKRARSLPTSHKDPGQKNKKCSSLLECRGKGVLLSPEKSPPMDLTQSEPGCLSSRSQNSPSSMNREDEVILLLDSDEELELEQTKRKPVLNGPSEERKVLEVSTKSSELFSIIDLDAEQEPSQSPPGREATLQQEGEGLPGNRGSVGVRGTPQLFCDPKSSGDEDSTTDTSWLVPATPLASRSRDCSSQTQIMGLRSRPSADPLARPKPRALLENRDEPETTNKFSVIVPQTSSSRLGPITPRSPDSRRQVCRSPSSPHPRRHQHFSLTPCPSSGGLADLTGQFQRHLSPVPSPAGQATASEVVEVEDSEEEQEVASQQASNSTLLDSDPPIPADDWCWHVEPLSPIPIDHLNLERTGPLNTSSPSSRAGGAPDSGDCSSPALLGTTPIRGSCTGRRKSQEKSPGAGSPGSSRLSFLNSALWDNWDGEEQKSPEALPLPKTPSAAGARKSQELQTPSANRKKNLPPKVPITPMPRYSIMEMPVLKKELDRFGVRPLPKRQMVLKLKEIFQYTHQTLESDSEEESQSSRVPLELPCSQTYTAKTSEASKAAGCTQLEATSGPIPQRSKGPAKTKGSQHQKMQPGRSIPALSMSPAKEGPPGPHGDTQPQASQESVDSSDSSCSSQSSSCAFGAALESAGEEEEGEEGVSASQAAIQAAATEEAVRRYIRSKPALYRKVLLYQPFELAELQAELKQQGIRVAMGKLLDFLDAQCITFTTAAARKEKLKRKRRKPVGKKKGGRTRGPVPCSPPLVISSL
ncbi:structure-specific endonuclease subunit SLX4 isoform X2 [Hippopotamus amphibius kiboko]|uniref:structure-specific endonuclease subunit SLX4 isoform X2 n=1 Tax=Hippopotamus amphibius kiboko TaxID=575201 RepID=UPI00259AA833|nr:structure-specific endonuclease subunit SLX4 isoform X2 [Hippopotamus amphibius kiboko]